MDVLRHCAYVLAVVDEGTFTDAAYTLGITQPPLSQGVRRLEERWKVRLLDRDARGVRLTAEGRRLLPVIRALVADAQALEQRAMDLGRTPGDVVCGVDPALSGVAEAVLSRYAVLAPGPLRLRTDVPERLLQDLREGSLDLAILRHPVVTDGLLTGGTVELDTQLLLPNLGAGPMSPHEVPVDLPLVLRPREEAPAAHDLLLHEAQRLGHTGSVLEVAHPPWPWIAAGAGWSVSPALAPEPPGVRTVPAPTRLGLRAIAVARLGSEDALAQVHPLLATLAIA